MPRRVGDDGWMRDALRRTPIPMKSSQRNSDGGRVPFIGGTNSPSVSRVSFAATGCQRSIVMDEAVLVL